MSNTSALVGNTGEYRFNVSINDTLDNKYSEILLVNVTLIVGDTTPPTWDNPRNFTHTVNTSFIQSFPATDDVAIDNYWLNDTTIFNVSQNGLITNNTNLSNIFKHWINISVNDTSNNIANIEFWINITVSPTITTGLSATNMIIGYDVRTTELSNTNMMLGYNANLLKSEENELTFTYRR